MARDSGGDGDWGGECDLFDRTGMRVVVGDYYYYLANSDWRARMGCLLPPCLYQCRVSSCVVSSQIPVPSVVGVIVSCLLHYATVYNSLRQHNPTSSLLCNTPEPGSYADGLSTNSTSQHRGQTPDLSEELVTTAASTEELVAVIVLRLVRRRQPGTDSYTSVLEAGTTSVEPTAPTEPWSKEECSTAGTERSGEQTSKRTRRERRERDSLGRDWRDIELRGKKEKTKERGRISTAHTTQHLPTAQSIQIRTTSGRQTGKRSWAGLGATYCLPVSVCERKTFVWGNSAKRLF
ncbi:hypothetical protein EX30DRAFT_390204 [Ascodesmis nigricans]|uniref:Uncharacterized protein n=1 Tax=Ascodesmis nigricans TaxID=341454 RepID=A0A4S2MIA5_9PEZI|nr:hypothetical protein EX30DRAFT_390204 [Ascodesmis nigricans]